ncbi:uncharacterized protein I206_105648 [Kwoniella pini CBS 10737]|uniref:Uncharacterized protein n=1 Tax=Kwoniella pini CBS 10737 TaxID=1296096 RepID=A0A1B9I3N0_9TREE|nr:uncharacterized protein I206_03452 [Kwoniella pini CBS 10737]OCF50133.1 hypothetical protein I206_03452 [Kwoniella pini CBS 10737]
MKPTRTLIPRLLPILKHFPTTSLKSSAFINLSIPTSSRPFSYSEQQTEQHWWMINKSQNISSVPTSSNYHNQFDLRTQYPHTSIYTSSDHLIHSHNPKIRFNDTKQTKDQDGITNVPPPTIAWNDHLSMV